MASTTEMPKFSEYEGKTNRSESASAASLSGPLRKPAQWMSPSIPSRAASRRRPASNAATPVPATTSAASWPAPRTRANACSKRSRPFFVSSRDRNSTTVRPPRCGARMRNQPREGRVFEETCVHTQGEHDPATVHPDPVHLRLDPLLLARVVDPGRPLEDPPLDQPEREPLEARVASLHPPPVERPERPDDVRHPGTPGCPGGRQGRVREERVDVHDIVLSHVPGQPAAERPGEPVEARLSREVPVRHRLVDDRHAQGHLHPARSVVVRRRHVDVHVRLRQAPRDGAHHHARAAPERTDRRDDLENPDPATLE